MNMHSNTHANSKGKEFKKCVIYNQVFQSTHPSPLIVTFMWKSTCSHICVFDRNLALGSRAVDGFDPIHGPNPPS